MQTMKAQIVPQHTTPLFGVFEVHANNRKRCAGKAIEYIDAFGSLYPDGTVHIHTRQLQVTDFTTMQQMRDYLESMGDCRIVWLAGPLASQVEEEMS